jgi:hypothetical protein
MTTCLQGQVDHIRDALGDGVLFADWYDAGMPFDVFDFGDDLQREAVSYARGYLEGAADLAGVTVLTLLDEHNVLTCQPKLAPRKRRKKAG